MILAPLGPGIHAIASAIQTPVDTLAFAVKVAVDTVSLPVEARVDPIAFIVETPIDSVPFPVQVRFNAIALALELFGKPFLAGLPCPLGLRVETRLDSISLFVEASIDTIAPSIEPRVDAIALVVETLFDAIAPPVKALLDTIATPVEALPGGVPELGGCRFHVRSGRERHDGGDETDYGDAHELSVFHGQLQMVMDSKVVLPETHRRTIG